MASTTTPSRGSAASAPAGAAGAGLSVAVPTTVPEAFVSST